MASLFRSARAATAPGWTVKEHALFAAHQKFELLKLLGTDEVAFATARTHVAWASLAADSHNRNRTHLQPLRVGRLAVIAARGLPTQRRQQHVRPLPNRRAARRESGSPHRPHPQPLLVSEVAADAPSAATRAAAPDVAASPRGNARQRRSSARSAQKHRRSRAARGTWLALFFLTKLVSR